PTRLAADTPGAVGYPATEGQPAVARARRESAEQFGKRSNSRRVPSLRGRVAAPRSTSMVPRTGAGGQHRREDFASTLPPEGMRLRSLAPRTASRRRYGNRSRVPHLRLPCGLKAE